MNFKKKLIILFSFIFITVTIFFIIIKKNYYGCDIKFVSRNFKFIEGNFKTTLEKELISAGISVQDRNKIIKACGKSIDFRKLNESDSYVITLSSSGDFISIDIDKGNKLYCVLKTSDSYTFQIRDIAIKISTYSLEGSVKNILWNSMIDVGVPADVILNYTDVFAWDVDFLTDVRDGDRFGVVFEERKNIKGKIISRKVLAGYYDGAVTGRKMSVWFGDDYYNESGESAKSMFLKAPLVYRRISSYFSYHRYHPVLKYVRPHLGIDYAAPVGTPVSSVADGIITYKGWKGGYGNYVEIKHNLGYFSSYGHLSGFSPRIYVGKKVKQGEVIGYVGMTGIATGPHLDFRIRHGDKFINYLKIKRSSNKKLPSYLIPELRKKLKEYFPSLL